MKLNILTRLAIMDGLAAGTTDKGQTLGRSKRVPRERDIRSKEESGRLIMAAKMKRADRAMRLRLDAAKRDENYYFARNNPHHRMQVSEVRV